MLSESEFKRAAALSILLLLIASPSQCQIEEIPFFAGGLLDPFDGNTLDYPKSACDSYVAKNETTWKIYTTEFCRTDKVDDLKIMRSEYEPIKGDVTINYKKSKSIPAHHKVVITTDSLLAELTDDWRLKVQDLTTEAKLFKVDIEKPANLSSYELTSTEKYFVLFYQTNSDEKVYEYILPISKTDGAKLWTEGMLYVEPYDRYRGKGYNVGAKMIIDYPEPKQSLGQGHKFFMAWEWSVNTGVSIKRKIIGPNLSDTGTEGEVESLSTVNGNQLEGLGIVNGNEFVIYSTRESNEKVIKMWRKNLNSNPRLVKESSIGKNPSLPYYKGAYVITAQQGQKIVLVFSQVTTDTTNVMYKVFNDDGKSASKSESPIVISQSDIKFKAVVLEDATLFMSMGPVDEVWYLGIINFINE